ncbi:P-loop containing nucleoside triphosphate hydrolase protein [Ilyonectria robusta]|uniref:P-loop containing nucleoside triphosphate hydrolase protein n=1 Tax=Ilyonectria robusta TaxID=1079257 RepID=UPI001E8D9F52|nr:P-loop containing nucleoside triphosphate hydrolase protein [Ilyonectria robusta]KAH8714479.1 P-loop containing nucleoside triphosphate hydrolase protein [Ilyonectria robusta]
MALEGRIDMWRTRVPSRLDREDPFEGDGFESRPATRLTFREPDQPVRRPSTRLSFLRSATPLFGRSSTSSSRDSASTFGRKVDGRRRGLLALFSRKRKQCLTPEPIPKEPVRLNYLFVGGSCSGQTSLLFRARYGYFPDTRAFTRPLYETYDTSGAPDLTTVERLAYMSWDAVFLCFDISDRVSMYIMIQWWKHASNNGFAQPGISQPLYLLGMKKDLRDQCFLMDHREVRGNESPGFFEFPSCCVCPSEGNFHASRIGACYLECSAATGEGMEAVFDEAAREATGQMGGDEEVEDVVPKKRRFF